MRSRSATWTAIQRRTPSAATFSTSPCGYAAKRRRIDARLLSYPREKCEGVHQGFSQFGCRPFSRSLAGFRTFSHVFARFRRLSHLVAQPREESQRVAGLQRPDMQTSGDFCPAIRVASRKIPGNPREAPESCEIVEPSGTQWNPVEPGDAWSQKNMVSSSNSGLVEGRHD